MKFTYPIKKVKTVPRDFSCSGCAMVVVAGSYYTKTGWGRYCRSCAARLPKDLNKALTPKKQ